jgi:hypothetical protein
MPATVFRNRFPFAPRPIVSLPVVRAASKFRFSIVTLPQPWA